MIRSMTGFGRGECSRNGSRFTVELKTVNHRFFEPSIRMGRKLAALENDLRVLLRENISRGKVEVSVTYELAGLETGLEIQEETLAVYIQKLRELGKRYRLKDDLGISEILTLPEVLKPAEEQIDLEEVWAMLSEAAKEALANLNAMREAEGERIRQDLLEKAEGMREGVEKLKIHMPQVEEEYRKKLIQRVEELTEGRMSLDPGVLENEVVLFADKCCIDEELVRLNSHITQMRTLLDSKEPVGRPLDFLMQEFNREANTIASKAGDLAVTQQALELKKEIEKVREQVQNLE